MRPYGSRFKVKAFTYAGFEGQARTRNKVRSAVLKSARRLSLFGLPIHHYGGSSGGKTIPLCLQRVGDVQDHSPPDRHPLALRGGDAARGGSPPADILGARQPVQVKAGLTRKRVLWASCDPEVPYTASTGAD